MTISAITTYLGNKSIQLLSGLANNSNSIMPMLVKDTISNVAIVDTYKKHGGKDDAKERAIEEFGTGAVWLLAIPGLKKIIDKVVYPKLNLNPDFDTKLIINNDSIHKKPLNFFKKFFDDGVNKEAYQRLQQSVKSFNDGIYSNEKNLLKSLENPLTSSLYKKAFVGKFLFSTAASALALITIIRLKQKSTQKRIEKDFYADNASKILLSKKLKKDVQYQNFTSKKPKKLSFTGAGNLINAFMMNPILNTLILDGVITSTRLIEARKGEKKEVALKEAFQIFFIYALAKPIQILFEKVGKSFNMPIELDPSVLFDKSIKNKLPSAIDDIKNLQNVEAKSLTEKLFYFTKENPSSALVDILNKNGVIPTIKDEFGNIKGMSILKAVNEKDLEKTLEHIKGLNKNISNLGKIKAFKVFSVISNVLIAALAMGVLQPKVNIAIRKLLNNGDNRNPAIVKKEEEMRNKLNFDK